MKRPIAATLVLGLLLADAALANPPNVRLRSGHVRQAGRLGTYCWSWEWETGGSGGCFDQEGDDFQPARLARVDRRARLRIRRDVKPTRVSLHAWRHVDEDEQPIGRGRNVSKRVKKRTRNGRTRYDVIFHLPKKPGHLYLKLWADWTKQDFEFGRGDAEYLFHLKLR